MPWIHNVTNWKRNGHCVILTLTRPRLYGWLICIFLFLQIDRIWSKEEGSIVKFSENYCCNSLFVDSLWILELKFNFLKTRYKCSLFVTRSNVMMHLCAVVMKNKKNTHRKGFRSDGCKKKWKFTKIDFICMQKVYKLFFFSNILSNKRNARLYIRILFETKISENIIMFD